MAVEPYVRRRWPKLLVSWQRLLSGRFRDPLVGRDLLLGGLAGAAYAVVWLCGIGLANRSGLTRVMPFFVDPDFGRGIWPSIGSNIGLLAGGPVSGCVYLGVLAILTGILRREWLGLLATGLILMVRMYSPDLLSFLLGSLHVMVFLAVLTRIGLVAAVSMLIVRWVLTTSPPLDFSSWYAGRAMIVLLIPLALLLYAFLIALGRQSAFGDALKEE